LLLFLFQTLVLVAAGFALLRVWRVAATGSRLIAWIVAGGILLRAVPGLVFFWISYLNLPFARSLQLGNGFWWFATDAIGYYTRAVNAVTTGAPAAIIHMNRTNPSRFYTQVLAVFVWLLGTVSSVGLLLNLFAYAGIAALMVTWARRYDVAPKVLALPLIAVSFSPSWVLWSSQPLKDAFFCFITIAFALTLDQWVRVWRAPELRPGRIVAAGVLLAVTMYGIAGIRWYYAFVALLLATLPVLSVVFARVTTGQRVAAATAGVVLLFALSQLIIIGAGPFLPLALNNVLRFRRRESVSMVPQLVENSRHNLDTFVNSGTRIRAGEALRHHRPPQPARHVNPVPAPVKPAQSAAQRVEKPAAHVPAAPPVKRVTTAPSVTAVPLPPVKPTAAPPVKPVTAAPRVPPGTTAPPVKPVTAAPRVKPPGEAESEGGGPAMTDVPVTVKDRLIAGFAALLLPHTIAEGLGLISVGSGRGFWWFADFDTLLFDTFLVLSVVIFLRRWRESWRDPFAWYLLGVSCAMAGALAYTISNFGALFRHRSMILAAVVLLPMAASRARSRPSVTAAAEPVPEQLPGRVALPSLDG
jgi:hypothetical protein